MDRNSELDDKARNDRRYRYYHSFGLTRQCRVVDILVDSTHCDNEINFDHRTSTINVTPHPRKMHHRSLTRASSTFPIPHMPIYPTIGHFGYPTPPMLPDRRFDLGMNMSPYPYRPHGYYDYLLVLSVGPIWGSLSWY